LQACGRILCPPGFIVAGRRRRRPSPAIVAPFPQVHSDRELFDAARAGLGVLLQGHGRAQGTAPQDWVLGLLAGTQTTSDSETQARVNRTWFASWRPSGWFRWTTCSGVSGNLDALSRGEKAQTPRS